MHVYRWCCVAAILFAGVSSRAEEPMTLAQALALALEKNPELAVFSAEIRAADARRLQASLFPNPELEAEVENIAGSGDFSGTRSAETTIQLSQLILLGGKRSSAVRAATLEREVAELDYAAKRLEIFGETTQAFLEVLSAQRQVELAEEVVLLSEKFAPAAEKRVQAGAASKVELTRLNIQLATARIEAERARTDLAAARRRLVAFWRGDVSELEAVAGDLESLPEVDSIDELNRRLLESPALARWERELARRQSTIHLARANRVPDLTIGAGYRYFNDTSDSAAVVAFGLPLPLFNRNQGAIREAVAERDKGENEQLSATVALRTELAVAFDALTTVRAQLEKLNETILPGARDVFEQINEGYLAGRFGYLEVIDAQRTLIEARLQYLEALTAYQQAIAEIEALTGSAINKSTERPDQKHE